MTQYNAGYGQQQMAVPNMPAGPCNGHIKQIIPTISQRFGTPQLLLKVAAIGYGGQPVMNSYGKPDLKQVWIDPAKDQALMAQLGIECLTPEVVGKLANPMAGFECVHKEVQGRGTYANLNYIGTQPPAGQAPEQYGGTTTMPGQASPAVQQAAQQMHGQQIPQGQGSGQPQGGYVPPQAPQQGQWTPAGDDDQPPF